MAIKIKSDKEHARALEVIEEYANQCPKCQSDNISNEDETDLTTCHDCSNQFSESDYMDKIHIVALLRVHKLPHAAKSIEEMELAEFDDFLCNHIYE